MQNKKVSIIIVTFNSAGTIQASLNSVLKQTYKNYEIILLDNGSQDNTLGIVTALLGSWHGDHKIVTSNSNLGFAEGNNSASMDTSGKYIALINPDAVVESDWLERLVAEMDDSSEVGICASKIINSHSGVIDSAGDGLSESLQGFKRGEGLPPDIFRNKEYILGLALVLHYTEEKCLNRLDSWIQTFF